MAAKIIISLTAAVLVLIAVCYLCIKAVISGRKEIRRLKLNAENLSKNIELLKEHAEKLEELKDSGSETKNRIRKAKNEEEVNNILSDIVSGNNKRVQDNSRNKNNPASRT